MESTLGYSVEAHRLDPILADLRLHFTGLPHHAEVRGRLMGPRCHGISTVEVAYHLRHVGGGIYQVLIPEPSLWSDDRPYFYAGPADVYHQGVKVATIPLSISLKTPTGSTPSA